MSPFTNTRTLHKVSNTDRRKTESNGDIKPSHDKSMRFNRWLPVISSGKWQEKYLSVMDLSKALQGFIVFEVAWKDVHGINYLNELLTDTTLALEVKSMKKWEFYSPEQASRCISSWFCGRASETQSLKKNLRLLSDLDLHHLNSHSSSMFLQRPSPSDVLSDDDYLDVQEDGKDLQQKTLNGIGHNSVLKCREMEDADITPTQYADTLILFRSSDSILPEKLRQVILPDLRLLTLLEAGLPSWVIFFQSYPLFCHFYRPWMRHLARYVYILISLVMVIIGFYDLYKNVPLLKSTVSHLCGPLFGWIEGWGMVSRIRYIGTMFFLQNIEKGLKWFLIMSRTTRTVLSTFIRPLTGPLNEIFDSISPLWNACALTGKMFCSTLWIMIESMYDVLLDFFEVFIWPFELLCSYIWRAAISMYPLMCSIWNLLLVPIRCALTLADYISSLLVDAFYLAKDVWESSRSISKITVLSETKQSAFDISIWKGLWNDLFSQVFRAIRSILNGLLAFFMACNRHRLSIYNHMRVFLHHLAHLARAAPPTCPCRQIPRSENPQEEDDGECDRCK